MKSLTFSRMAKGTQMAILVALCFILYAACRAPKSALSSGEEKTPSSLGTLVDNYIQSFPPREEFSGVVLVADGNTVLFHKGYGLANREFGIPNGKETRFQIGSITKAFTSILALKLVEEGRLDLDKHICDYLPYYPEKSGRKIKIRHLLSNTSGIPHHYQVIPDYWVKEDHYFHTPKELIALFWDAPLLHEPGERLTYSSPGFYIMGAILQQVGKRSYAELLKEYILDPLGMENTFVENNRTTDANLATGYIRGISGLVKVYSEDKSTALAAGDISSTAYDLYLWQKTLSLNGDKILTASSKKVLFQSVLPDSPMTMLGPHYRIPYEDGKKTLAVSMLNGSSSGYVSCIGRQTEADRCVIVLSNVNGDDAARIADDIGDIFTRRYLGIAVGEEAPLTRTPPAGAGISEGDLEKILGFYRSQDGNYTGVIRDGGKLFSLDFSKRSGIQWAMELTPITADTYYWSHNPSFRCVFSSDEKGGISGLSVSRRDRVFNHAERLLLGGLEDFDCAGYYTSVELQKTYCLKIIGNDLIAADFLGEPSVRLVPLEKDVFGFDRGFIRFTRDKINAITGFEVFTKDTDAYFGSRFIKIVV
jgi:CubicO group peptidase (beta-lactamase class C family)